MATTINFYRPNRNWRSVFREGRYLLNTEAGELQLEVLQALREHIKTVFGDDVAVTDSFKLEADSVDTGRIIIRPGHAYVDGYPIRMESGQDTLYQLGTVPVQITGADFIRLQTGDASGEGIALQLGGASPLPAGDYSILIELKEDLITANQDPFLRSANLSENTADKHRLIYNIHIVDSSVLNSSPMPYVGSADGNFVDEVVITRSGSNYSAISYTAVTGSESIDGRNLEVVFNNGNGTSTARFPISNIDLLEYRNGVLIDSNGTPFFITNMVVTPGNASRITMTIDLEKTRPLQLNTFQSNPVITDGTSYRLVKRDLYVTSSASLPEGRRFFHIADFTWGGSSIAQSDITDYRGKVLAYDGVLDLIREMGLRLYSEGNLFWDASINSGYFQWDADLKIHSAFDGFEWTIPASDTATLFAAALAQNEVLYVRLGDAPAGGTLTLRKGVRGTGELTRTSIQASNIFWVAKRHPDDRLYLNPDMILNDQQTKPFYDIPIERLVAQDILTLGYNAMFDEDLQEPSAINPAETSALFFANSYVIDYSNRVITVAVNNIMIPTPCSFTVQVGDVIVQSGAYSVITSVNTQQDFNVVDGSVFTTASSATISQKVETLNLRTIGSAKERIASYYTDSIDTSLLVYEDGEVQAIGNPIITAFSATSDGSSYTAVLTRPAALSDFNNRFSLPTPGTDYRLRFFSNVNGGDGSALLESFRAFMHRRAFVGTLLPAVSSPGGGAGNNVVIDNLTNPQVFTLQLGRVVRMTPSGINYADASSVTTGESVLGVLLNNVLSGGTPQICSIGLAPNAITGLGFTTGDQVFLGTSGQLVDSATVGAYPPGYVIREIGVALNGTDLFVLINPLDII
jgi:hypothetical protein